ncbi:hypothetical protein [Aliiglaciecola sp. LCG003]|uniref:hypothetical protein n=1 Tax=Aliiglaciecola sp. LCG003 TaxID=3053655 RepID=UPI002572FEF9|nr:hypothetical protein [Aliiglaciecola sp. LCG003]WJG09237.1 hypothetical protein QR722_18200 [Aliiglaciecola sp. LCG003]
MEKYDTNRFEREWITLQNQYDSYEKYSMLIKLFSVAVCSLLVFHQKLDLIISALCTLLWMLDAIWKTFQHRISQRLLIIEAGLAGSRIQSPMQYNTAWLANRPNAFGLTADYLKSGLSPTILGPHLIIIAITLFVSLSV